MNVRLLSASFLTCFLIGVLPLAANGQDFVAGELIVRLKPELKNQDQFLGKAVSQKGLNLKRSWKGLRTHHFKIGFGKSMEQALDELRSDPDVAYAEPNYLYRKTNDTGITQILSAEQIQSFHQDGKVLATDAPVGVQELWDARANEPDSDEGSDSSENSSLSADARPIVAVIDTGVDISHSVFVNSQAIWTNPGEVAGNGIDDDGNGYVDDVHGWNFVDNSGAMYDDDGHGTHVAGIVLSVDQDIFASTLKKSRVRIMPLKFLDGNGSGSTADAIQAIYYALNKGAKVLNNSWGGPGYSSALLEAIVASYSQGVSFIAAAGNAGSNNDSAPMYPANYDVPQLISTAATTSSDYLASFSNYGVSSVHVGSPGVHVLSTLPGNKFGTSSGTSMAAPFVAGIVGQMSAVSPNMLGYQSKTLVFNTAENQGQLNGKVSSSARVHANAAVQAAQLAQVESSQPVYAYSAQAERSLASESPKGGCGTVGALKAAQSLGRKVSLRGPWSNILVLLMILAPVAIAMVIRSRSPKSRRKHDRFSIESDVRLRVGGKELMGSVSSISMGGVQLNTEALLEKGGVVSMKIASPDGKDIIEVEGRVVWSEAQKSYGVAFEDAKTSTLNRIFNWTRALPKAS